MFENLCEDNFTLYAIKEYQSLNCVMSEFENDLKKIKYVKKLVKKYKVDKILKERLILNHIILLYNVFGPAATTRILFFKFDKEDYGILKTFLLYLNLMPDVILGIDGKHIISDEILMDVEIYKRLREL